MNISNINEHMTEQSYFSRGKLMITGEYLVMEGALSLALPLKLGQTLTVRTVAAHPGTLHWTTLVNNEPWFDSTFNHNFGIVETSAKDKAFLIQQILHEAFRISGKTLQADVGYEVSTNLNFSPEWGFGSSSSLISNIAYWVGCDPFELFRHIATGSGYDIACARAESPILYSLVNGKPAIEPVHFRPSFSENIWFIYLGKKQVSAESLAMYRMKIAQHHSTAQKITEITNAMVSATNLANFETLVSEHEDIIAKVIDTEPIKKSNFANFPGTVKSLGAWGGDFIMVTHSGTRAEVEKYFQMKGLWPIFSFKEIIQ